MKNENDINSGVKVKHAGIIYETGNRRHSEVELYRNGKFEKIVLIRDIRKVDK